MEVNYESETNFISVFSIKNYQVTSLEALNEILHLPIEITISEVFYPSIISKATEYTKYQDYVLKVSKDEDLLKSFKTTEFITPKPERKITFFERQINITISNKNKEALEQNLHQLASKLNSIGLLHVVEDVLIEHSLWAQLPGNFNYLKRISYTTIDYVAAFASFYSYNIGRTKNSFGKALTILNSNKNNPYYFNIHNSKDKGLMCIIGKKKSGKTLTTNFLVSETTKYNPQILYIATNSSSQIFVEGLGGKWCENFTLNPFLTDNAENDLDIEYFCNMLTTVKEISELQLTERQSLYEVIKKLPQKKRTIENILKKLDNNLSEKLKFLLDNEDYANFFTDKDELEELLKNDIICFDMSKMTEQYFYNKYYAAAQLPKEREVYSAHLELNNNVKSILLSHIFKSFFKTSANDENRLKILVIEDTMLSLNNLVFENFHEDCEDFIARKNIIIANIDSDNLDSYITKPIENIINNCNTKILLPGEKLPGTFADLLNISLEQLLILNRIPEGSGFFFLQQDDLVTILGLNLYDFTALIAILSSNEDSIAMFQELKKQGVEMDNIIANLYQHFNVTL